jgi:hypothetical protein
MIITNGTDEAPADLTAQGAPMCRILTFIVGFFRLNSAILMGGSTLRNMGVTALIIICQELPVIYFIQVF